MGSESLRVLRERITVLDEGVIPQGDIFSDPALMHFSEVMQSYTNTDMGGSSEERLIVDAHEADDVVASCRLLAAITRSEPRLTVGPLAVSEQHWIGTSRESNRLSESDFRDPRRNEMTRASTKPFDLGLYTSTVTAQGHSMWRILLEDYRGSALFPLPWRTWNLDVVGGPSSVVEIGRACDWVGLVERYPTYSRGLVYPNWPAIAEDVSAVHVMLPVIAAMQGFYLESDCGLIAPSFWDVESTLWLRWEFSGMEEVEVVTE